MAIIEVDDLSKTFKVPVREQGLRASIRSLVHRETKEVTAVDSVSFTIEPGEVVGFLGPNGAGKTTTLKMLSGLLHPTGGQCRVLGLRAEGPATPSCCARSHWSWEIGINCSGTCPALDSFELNRAIYRIPRAEFVAMRDELIELLDIGDLVTKPVRNLSLGERMKMEIAGALLHRPKVLFLDEPTIGLDITMQRRIRSFVADYNIRYGATVILTSHYMADVQALCKRVIVIHHGRLVFDGDLSGVVRAIHDAAHDHGSSCRRRGDHNPRRRVPTPRRRQSRLLADHDVVDLTIEDPPIDDVIEQVFADAHDAS